MVSHLKKRNNLKCVENKEKRKSEVGQIALREILIILQETGRGQLRKT